MNTNEFFDESREQSQVKARIVSKYFASWADIMKRRTRCGRLAYIELFAGTGRYNDGTASTPLMVLQRVIAREDLREIIVTIFIEKNRTYCSTLQTEIAALPEVGSLRFPPKVVNQEVDKEIAQTFNAKHLVPALVFVDPCGYKGLSLDLINSVIKDWACECLFFFNYNRINAGLMNELVDQHMNDIFGEDRANSLRMNLPDMKPHQKEKVILSALTLALQETHGKYVLPFRFEMEDGSRTSHYIVHVCKHPMGYALMKEIMAKESTWCPQGVHSFEFVAAAKAEQPVLLDTCYPMDELKAYLLRQYAGRSTTRKAIYEEHNVGTPYIKNNYRDALLQLESEGLISVSRKVKRLDTLGEDVPVRFLH